MSEDTPFISVREMLSEVRNDVKAIGKRLDTDFVTKPEFETWQKTAVGNRRFLVTTMIALAVVGVSLISLALEVLKANTP